MIEADNLVKTFNASGNKPVRAVQGASFTVAPGEIFGLLGPNGAGKTTLLRMLGTIITPTSGHCSVCGTKAHEDPEDIRRHIGFLSGNTKLYGRLSAREMLQYFGRLYSMDDDSIKIRIAELSDLLEMDSFIDRRCESFSTGQAQKVSIARVILHNPSVLILDEPTLGLDIMTCQTILNFIKKTKNQQHSIIFSTHYMTEAEMLCDRIGFIYEGKIMAIGTQDELYQQTQTDNLTDAFLAMANSQARHTA